MRFYVDTVNGNDANSGKREGTPYKTPERALEDAELDDEIVIKGAIVAKVTNAQDLHAYSVKLTPYANADRA